MADPNRAMTLHQLLRLSGVPTSSKYEIMQRADRMFCVGRYWGGQLTPVELARLTDKVEMSTVARALVEGAINA